MTIDAQTGSVRDVINEVRLKKKLPAVSALDDDSLSVVMLKYLNDVMSEINDFGRWQEDLASTLVTAQASVSEYSINVTAPIHDIAEIAFEDRVSNLRYVSIETMRRLNRSASRGQPSQFTIFGTDSNNNPKFKVSPIPTTAYEGKTFDILYYKKPSIYVTADVSAVITYPKKLVISGLMAKVALDESEGMPTQEYQMYKIEYDNILSETYNRYNSDTGNDVKIKPARW